MNEALKSHEIYEQKKATTLNNTIYNCIVFIVATTILFFESIFTLISIFKLGFFKKEILTTKSHVGFDIVIKNN